MTHMTRLWPGVHVAVWLLATLGGLQGCQGALQNGAPHGVVSNIPRQDGVCSVPGGLNQDSCAIDCCDAHDRCYANFGCTALSWLTGGLTPECQECNQAVLDCLGATCGRDEPDVPSGKVRCGASVECPGALICTDRTCSGEGLCFTAWSGVDGDCCNHPVDCQSGMCLEGRCVLPDERARSMVQMIMSLAQGPPQDVAH